MAKPLESEIARKQYLRKEADRRMADRLNGYSATMALFGLAGIIGISVWLMAQMGSEFQVSVVVNFLRQNTSPEAPWYYEHRGTQISAGLLLMAIVFNLTSAYIRPKEKKPWDMEVD